MQLMLLIMSIICYEIGGGDEGGMREETLFIRGCQIGKPVKSGDHWSEDSAERTASFTSGFDSEYMAGETSVTPCSR